LLTLKNVLPKNGFKLLDGNEKVESLFIVKELMVKEVVNDYLPIHIFLEKAEFKR